eukprot:364709-Chlamydomonas_euryale.AAC.2
MGVVAVDQGPGLVDGAPCNDCDLVAKGGKNCTWIRCNTGSASVTVTTMVCGGRGGLLQPSRFWLERGLSAIKKPGAGVAAPACPVWYTHALLLGGDNEPPAAQPRPQAPFQGGNILSGACTSGLRVGRTSVYTRMHARARFCPGLTRPLNLHLHGAVIHVNLEPGWVGGWMAGWVDGLAPLQVCAHATHQPLACHPHAAVQQWHRRLASGQPTPRFAT